MQNAVNYHDHTFRVRYSETDQMGVVHNSVYQIWFEMGRTEYSIAQGFPYSQLEDSGIILVVAEANVRFKTPAYYEELLTVRAGITKYSAKVIRFEYSIFRPATGEVIADGHTVHVAVDKVTRKSTRIPEDTLNAMLGKNKNG